jgi:hypothetical protein
MPYIPTTVVNAAASGTGGVTPGQILSYPTTFTGDTINGSSTTPFADVTPFNTKEVLNSRILHLQTLGASKDQRVRVTLGTTKAAAFDVSTAVAFGGTLWSAPFDAYLEIRLSTSADAQIAIARIGVESFVSNAPDIAHYDTIRVGGSSVSNAGDNIEHYTAPGTTYTVRWVRDGSNVISFSIGCGTLPMALVPVIKTADDNPFTATVSGTLARIEYAIHTPGGPGGAAQWDAYVDYLASV